MNKTYITLAATTALALTLASCQKGDLLNVVQDDVELNENTAQYQEFIKERVTDYARAYRFEQARANLPKLTDEANRKEGERIINFYHAKALKDGFAYLLPNGDSLFLKMKNEENLPPEKIEHILQFNQYAEFKGLGQDVTLWGAGNFPNTKSIYITEAQITKMLDLDKLTKLEEVRLIFEAGNFDYTLWFPNRPFKPIDVSGYDFSKNDKITWMEFKHCDLTAIKAPTNVFPMFKASYCEYNANTINTPRARKMQFETCNILDPDIKVTNPHLRSLTITTDFDANNRGFRTFDISASRINCFSINQQNSKQHEVEEIKLNQYLDTLEILGLGNRQKKANIVGLDKINKLKRLAYDFTVWPMLPQDIPCAVTSLSLPGSNTPDIKVGTKIDYTKVQGLRELENQQFITANTIYPENLDSLVLKPLNYINPVKTLDLSHTKLKRCELYFGWTYGTQEGLPDMPRIELIKMPTTIEKLDLSSIKTDVLDLTGLDNLRFLKINDDLDNPIKRIIFPKNLKRSNFKKSDDFIIRVDKGKTKLVNYPSWVTQDEFGNDVAK
jgi:hypothetical protein